MKGKPALYVTDWAPNGTNDLLVVQDGHVIACLPEATFGIDVSIQTAALTPWGIVDMAVALEEIEETVDWVRPVSLEMLGQSLAVHPFDRGHEKADLRMLAFLNEHGII